MGFQNMLAQLAEGIAVGFVEEAAEQMRERASASHVHPEARAMGRQLASSAVREARDSSQDVPRCEVKAVRGELLPSQKVDEQTLIALKHAVWNPKQLCTAELRQAWAEYQERIRHESLD